MTAAASVAADIAAICRMLALPCSAAQAEALVGYVDLLERWNATYNLTAVRHRSGILTQHLADCLAVVPSLLRHRDTGALLDVGSGGGLPGVVIAVMVPGLTVTCLDAVAKKAAFLRQVAGTLQLTNLRAEQGRVEQQGGHAFNVITSRAFASLAGFVANSRGLLANGGSWLAMKGALPTEEIALLPDDIQVFHVEQLMVPSLAKQRCLVWLRLATGQPDDAIQAPPP